MAENLEFVEDSLRQQGFPLVLYLHDSNHFVGYRDSHRVYPLLAAIAVAFAAGANQPEAGDGDGEQSDVDLRRQSAKR